MNFSPHSRDDLKEQAARKAIRSLIQVNAETKKAPSELTDMTCIDDTKDFIP